MVRCVIIQASFAGTTVAFADVCVFSSNLSNQSTCWATARGFLHGGKQKSDES